MLRRLILTRPLIIFDVETTGVHPQVDRVIQIGLVKVYPDGHVTEWMTYVNPEMPIPPEVTEKVHHISDEMVKDAPKFRDIAHMLASGLLNCDYGGFNVRFDLLFLRKEYERVRVELRGVGEAALQSLNSGKIVDPFRIYVQKEPRNLEAAVEEYLGEKIEGAHDALADSRSALRVFLAQLERYPDLPGSVEELHKIYFESPAEGHLDPEGKLAWRFGEATVNFGNKYPGVPLSKVDRGYLRWMMGSEFSAEVKRIVSEALEGRFPRRD